MGAPIIQIPSIVLPQVWSLGTETETVADLLEHTSVDIAVSASGQSVTEYLQEKLIQIVAIEVVVAGVPGNLLCWIELSPVPSTISAAFWAAIGGGGGALPPLFPTVEVATGVDGTVHTILIPWVAHSTYSRLVVQTPVAAALPTAFWVVQAQFSGKGP